MTAVVTISKTLSSISAAATIGQLLLLKRTSVVIPMMRKPIFKFILMSLCLGSLNSMGETLGPWPHQYFKSGQRLSCLTEADSCTVPRMDDLQSLKTDWLGQEQARLQRVERISELARLQAEKILVVANEELAKNDQSSFGSLYMEFGSKLLDNIGERKIDRARLLVSQSSPMFLKIVELEGKLIGWQNQIEEQEDANLKEALVLLRKEKYREWATSKEYIELLDSMEVFQKEFFPKEEDVDFERNLVDGMMNLRVELSEHISFANCPNKVEKDIAAKFGAIQFSKIHRKSGDWDPIKDKSFLRFIMTGPSLEEPLRVVCEKASVLARVKASLEKGHKLIVRYRIKKEQNGVDSFKLPSRSDLIDSLK